MKKFLVIMTVCVFALISISSEAGRPKKKTKTGSSSTKAAVVGVAEVTKTKKKSGKKNHNGPSSNSVNNTPKNSPVNTGEIEKMKREIEFLKGERDWMKPHLAWQDKQINSLKDKKQTKIEKDVEELKKKKVDGNISAQNFEKIHDFYDRMWLELLCLFLGVLSIILIIVNGRRDKTRNDRLDRLSQENEERKEREKASGTT